uniref:Uncharacterized protein n=1 Tax=Anguilla anguilla TaxID=7936 RepID=A0A0E9UHQ1_ANGAN
MLDCNKDFTHDTSFVSPPTTISDWVNLRSKDNSSVITSRMSELCSFTLR